MKSIFSRLRSKIVHSKIFIHRAMTWISIINAGMLLFLVLSQLEQYGFDIRIGVWFVPIFIFTLLLMVVFGYLEYKLGFYQAETEVKTRRNPYFQKIEERLDRIEKKLGKRR